MAIQIVMDATGDTRHEFDPADAAALGSRVSLQGIDQNGLYRSSAQCRRTGGARAQL